MAAPSSNFNPAITLTDGAFGLVYYGGWYALAKGMIATHYGISGMIYHTTKAVESVFANGWGHESVTNSLGEAKKFIGIALPGIALIGFGVVMRFGGEWGQGDVVHGFVNQFYKAQT